MQDAKQPDLERVAVEARNTPPVDHTLMSPSFSTMLCDAMSHWGDPYTAIKGVCEAIGRRHGVISCAAYGRGQNGMLGVYARWPYVTTDCPALDAEIEMAREIVASRRRCEDDRVMADGTLVIGDIVATGWFLPRIAFIVCMDPRHGSRAEQANALAYAVSSMRCAFESLGHFEGRVENRAFERFQQQRLETLAAVSHEMRTPLASIKGYATSLLREDVSWDRDTHREFLETISEESDKLEEYVNNIIDSSALELGLLPLKKVPVLLRLLCMRVISEVSDRNSGHRFVTSFDPDLPIVEADPRRLEQVLFNILDNAVKYSSSKTSILISARELGDEVVVSISDQGVGIPPEHLNRLFEKFFRGSLTRRSSGLGLGLPIARMIVERHGGRIWAESKVGKGTTFYFTLPVHREDAN